MRGVRECRVRFLEFEVGNENIAVAAVGRERKPALGFPRFPPPAISTAGLAGRMLLPLPATSALANLSRHSYPHQTAKNQKVVYIATHKTDGEIVLKIIHPRTDVETVRREMLAVQ